MRFRAAAAGYLFHWSRCPHHHFAPQPGFVHVYYVFGRQRVIHFLKSTMFTDNGTVVAKVEDHNSGASWPSSDADGKFTILTLPIHFHLVQPAGIAA